MTPRIEPFFDATTSTFTYVIYEAPGSRCAIVDSVLDYDPHSGRTATLSADRVARFVRDQGLTVEWLLETHAHADHLSAAPYLRRQLGGRIAIGEGIRRVQGAFKDVFNLEAEFRLDGSQFDHLFQPDEVFHIGALSARALHVPGHTPADMAYQVEEDHVFVGDTLFMPDVGSARCDFPGGSARDLYRSIRRLLTLPEATRLYLCHDYPPAGREARHETTVGEERALNVHVRDGVDEDAFVALRTRRDATLSMPTLILPAIQVNIRAGTLPPAEANGRRYLKIPIDGF
ncbi:glyoxylase-like metal-dependent hydrolase (beta-lactamase superfamily II) [Pseudomonas sp. SORGH_AS199]|jgi:glyoxylase-like metal-dependent hydrolase (beta-lactamase superfamily II)|uniref:MBL fold metallo-hydrolase n=1 Tax=Pseudomonas flavocrustae TaxID=2991719 RepID=A0ABT6IKH9_9PSED|nr:MULTISPECIES: MBL fold metallo-hydrolase [Pseudomonas]MDH4764974.1 MBL fold metallo-hydrolase [Pseudomonas sp. CBMAI 2609]MDK8265253.1 MBL fold metallo-hydrolase [Pseudomonas oryzihabitans]MDR6229312.1 glyoxylase-like metal-dependent hydrolase (beta-lactamase superfamily II) [Pseudomonas sp. SORGH_AS_0199]QNQ98517.1 MBL fold metallo-hydrolase [Pseudomonas psychrotolerans]